MDAISSRIQLDLWWFSWIAFAIAIPLYAFLRQRDPLIRWHEHGNVSTRSFNGFDLAVVIGFFLFSTMRLSMRFLITCEIEGF